MNDSVVIEIVVNTCEKCPYSLVHRAYSSDAFESLRKVYCEKLKKDVHKCLGWRETSKIPEECPFRKSNE